VSIEKTFEKVEAVLKGIKGTLDIKRLSPEHRLKVLELEEAFEEETSMRSRRFYNEGIREVLDRQEVIVLAYNNDFRHPPEPLVRWRLGGVDIGEEVWDAKVLEELRGKKDALLIGDTFVIYRDRLKDSPLVDFVILFPALSFPELEGLDEIKDVVSASPSAPTDIYIRHIMGWDPKIGIILIGFDLTEST
jgi:hypothetical protein